MSTNVYNEIHKLAHALKSHEDYLALCAAKNGLVQDETGKKLVQDFMSKQMEVQIAMMSGNKDENKDKIEQIQKLYEIIALNNNARDYLARMMKFTRVVEDMHRILNDAIKEGMDLFENKEA